MRAAKKQVEATRADDEGRRRPGGTRRAREDQGGDQGRRTGGRRMTRESMEDRDATRGERTVWGAQRGARKDRGDHEASRENRVGDARGAK